MILREIDLPINEVLYWTDSTCVLAYISNQARRFKTFVANKTALICETTQPSQWKYLNTQLNVADDVSRGDSADTIEQMIQYFSSTFKLKKHIAWILRYRSKLLSASQKTKKKQEIIFSSKGPMPIAAKEIQCAEIKIVKYVQRRCFAGEVSSSKSSKLHKLNAFRVNGLLRVGERLRKAPIGEEAKYPILLPKSHHLTNLIVRHYHETSGHAGVEHVLSLTRERFWPINGRATVKKVVNSCFSCRKRYASPGIQKMTDLPTDRVQPDRPPFSHVGVDCFGPFVVKRGRADVKRYGIVYTCLTVCCKTRSSGVSDNGTNFAAGNRELREAIEEWNEQQINKFMIQQNIKWVFNPSSASHQGGVWERCVRSIRRILSSLTQEQKLDDEALARLMCEIEAIVNSRPITKVSDDPRDLQPLTPNHLLLLRNGPQLPPGAFAGDEIYARRRWRQVQHLADTFWRRWTQEYLPQLQQRQKWFYKKRNLAVDDIVLIVDDRCPRSTWPLGRIVETHTNLQDGCVRSAKVKTTSTMLLRPITRETVESTNS
ncbi:uncharacterized protein [Montipora capricornis]|uniref:uncharacterized protein n=1 Tax=Montipora capricornis TaxID=246305 RepID=UPI0035F181D7